MNSRRLGRCGGSSGGELVGRLEEFAPSFFRGIGYDLKSVNGALIGLAFGPKALALTRSKVFEPKYDGFFSSKNSPTVLSTRKLLDGDRDVVEKRSCTKIVF